MLYNELKNAVKVVWFTLFVKRLFHSCQCYEIKYFLKTNVIIKYIYITLCIHYFIKKMQ